MKTVILFCTLVLFSPHEFHLSLTEIDHNAEKKTLQIAVKLFTDDLTVALERSGKKKLNIGAQNEVPEANELIAAYLKQLLLLKVNGKQVAFDYLGKEAETDATWCYVEVKNVAKVQTLEVQNTLLIEAFDDQTNMVNLNINGRKKSGLARKGNSKLTFEF